MAEDGTDPDPQGGSPRRRYGFARTSCACRRCTISCEHVPGALCPEDLEVVAGHLGFADVTAFAREHLSASEGVTITVAATGERLSLRTLVPASRADGSCTFLECGRCRIHAVSPYGCAFIDAHQGDREYAVRADALYRALYDDLIGDGPYVRVWRDLHSAGRRAVPLGVRQANLADAMRREGMG